MKKLKLDPEALAVESFAATAVPADVGTVRGLAYTPACDSLEECKLTVVGTDDPSCALWCTGSCQNSDCANAQTCTCG